MHSCPMEVARHQSPGSDPCSRRWQPPQWLAVLAMALAALSILAAALPAQSPPFSTAINLATSPRLGWVANVQAGNQSFAIGSAAWCEQDVFTYTPAGTAVHMGQWGWSPTIGNQIVFATEGLRCQPFPPFQPFFPVGSYVPMLGISFTNTQPSVPVAGAHPAWGQMQLDVATAVFVVPPYVAQIANGMVYERFLATIDVPGDPNLIGTVLHYQAFRLDPFTGQWFASRTFGLWLQ